MPGVLKNHPKRDFGRTFPASRYNDPRGGRPSALERNVLRYRAIEAALYLFYTEEIRAFMVENLFPRAVKEGGAPPWTSVEERRLQTVLSKALLEGTTRAEISAADADTIRSTFASEQQQSKKLRRAFAYAVRKGIFTDSEASELKALLDYRNDIAHRIHLVMSDVSRCSWTTERFIFTPPTYKGDALDKLRAYRKSLWKRTERFTLMLSMDGLIFDFAERAYEAELKRLDQLIKRQIRAERQRAQAVSAELDLSGTELIGDLSPRFPYNHRAPRRTYGDDYVPATGHLTKRGIEICYRLFDMGKSPMAVAYLMGMTLRSAERRQRSWRKAGGPERERLEVERFDLTPFQNTRTLQCGS